MKKNSVIYMVPGVFLGLSLMTGLVLGSMRALAEESVVDNVTITVPEACSITTPSGTGETYNETMTGGQYKNDIGKTRIKVFCNSDNSMAIYAVGYSGDEFGNTEMITTATGATNIATGTATSGDTSNWAMKLERISGATTPNIVSPFNNFAAVPSSYAKVVEATSVAGVMTEAEVDASYAVYLSMSQTAGTYTGKVRYTVIQPSSAVPDQPYATNAGKIGYYPGGDGRVVDTMGDQSIADTDTSAELWASNFQRPGYGFAGWSDKFDWKVNANDANGNGTGVNAGYHIYGPNQTISFTSGQYASEGLSLYAVWVKSAGSLQSWNGCGAMSTGQVTALTDARDNNTYAVAKLADGKCWMIENLRLDNTNSDNATGTLAQGYASNFIGLANPETANFYYNGVTNSLYSTDGSTAAPAITGSYTGYRFPRFNNQNTTLPATLMYDTSGNTYGYGNYYTWPAAVADTGYYTSGSVTTTSICPKGWHLPTGGSATAEFGSLDTIMGGTGAYQGTAEASQRWRKFPNNFVYPGIFDDSLAYNRGRYGFYWSSSVYDGGSSYYLDFWSSGEDPGTDYDGTYYGLSVRCLVD